MTQTKFSELRAVVVAKPSAVERHDVLEGIWLCELLQPPRSAQDGY
jgi:hypothetical protein